MSLSMPQSRHAISITFGTLQLGRACSDDCPAGTDVTDEASYPRLVKEVEDVVKGSGLNLLINNAGLSSNLPLHELTSEQMRHNYDVNCVAPIMLTKVSRERSADAAVASGRALTFIYLFIYLFDVMDNRQIEAK